MINKYIEALREFKIEKIVEDQNDFKYVADAVNDYIFYLEDGREFLISIFRRQHISLFLLRLTMSSICSLMF